MNTLTTKGGDTYDVKTYKPAKFYIPNDKVTHKSFDGTNDLFQPGMVALWTGGKRDTPNEIRASARLTFDQDIHGLQGLNEWDYAVYGAITTLYEAGNNFMTLAMIYRSMVKPTARLSQTMAKKIYDTVLLLTQTGIQIDSTDERKRYPNLAKRESARFVGHLIDGRILVHFSGTIQGRIIPDNTVLQVLAEPILYQYARLKRQVISGPMGMLCVPVNQNQRVITAKHYLIRRIQQKTKNKDVAILYRTLYEKVGINSSSRTKLSRFRKGVCELLNSWKKQEFIKDWREENSMGETVGRNRRPYRLVILLP